MLTLLSAVGIVLFTAGLGWTVWIQMRDFPPDVANPKALAWPLPEIPSAVVIPIGAVTQTDRDALVAGRFGDDLITMLSRVPGLFLISPETSSRFSGGQFRVKSTAEALGVRYLISGTLSRVGEKYRVFLRVIDAFSGEVEWVEDYDADPREIFKVPGIARSKILDAMDVELADDEAARIWARGPSNYDAWVAYAEAVAYRVPDDRQSMSNSLKRLLQAHAADPDWSAAPVEIAWTYLNAARHGWGELNSADVASVVAKGLVFAEMVIRGDPQNPLGPAHKAALLEVGGAVGGDTEQTIAAWRAAARLGPNTFSIQWALSQALIRAGRHGEALPVMEHALRVHPRHPVALTQNLAELQFAAGDPDAAFASLDAVIEKRPAAEAPRLMRIYIHDALGRKAEAATEVRAFLDLHPYFKFAEWSARQARRGRPSRAQWRDVLRAAGIPD
ncbi:MAG: tetratricopeptide repeat protein [Proteobacteria bacterium]|nr:tetratricopeptide repeat protein [Pseudomonadota bacterium]MDA1309066.1 tetratricopeptide repeat protein [Pseudomonadota bacterium]